MFHETGIYLILTLLFTLSDFSKVEEPNLRCISPNTYVELMYQLVSTEKKLTVAYSDLNITQSNLNNLPYILEKDASPGLKEIKDIQAKLLEKFIIPPNSSPEKKTCIDNLRAKVQNMDQSFLSQISGCYSESRRNLASALVYQAMSKVVGAGGLVERARINLGKCGYSLASILCGPSVTRTIDPALNTAIQAIAEANQASSMFNATDLQECVNKKAQDVISEEGTFTEEYGKCA